MATQLKGWITPAGVVGEAHTRLTSAGGDDVMAGFLEDEPGPRAKRRGLLRQAVTTLLLHGVGKDNIDRRRSSR
jgi:hypothetical protein